MEEHQVVMTKVGDVKGRGLKVRRQAKEDWGVSPRFTSSAETSVDNAVAHNESKSCYINSLPEMRH